MKVQIILLYIFGVTGHQTLFDKKLILPTFWLVLLITSELAVISQWCCVDTIRGGFLSCSPTLEHLWHFKPVVMVIMRPFTSLSELVHECIIKEEGEGWKEYETPTCLIKNSKLTHAACVTKNIKRRRCWNVTVSMPRSTHNMCIAYLRLRFNRELPPHDNIFSNAYVQHG